MGQFDVRQGDLHTREKTLDCVHNTFDLVFGGFDWRDNGIFYPVPDRGGCGFDAVEHRGGGVSYRIKHRGYLAADPVHHSGNRGLDSIPDGGGNGFYSVEHSGDRCAHGVDHRRHLGMNGVPHRMDHGLDGSHCRGDHRGNRIDSCRNCAFDVLPGPGDGFFTVFPDEAEGQRDNVKGSLQDGADQHNRRLHRIAQAVPNVGEEGCDAVPNVFKKCFYIRPDFIPACTEPAQRHIRNAPDSVQNVFEERGYPIPDGGEDFLHTCPCLRPVPGKDADEHIQDAGDNARHCGEDVGNVIEHTFKQRGQHRAEGVPGGFQYVQNVGKLKPQRIQSVYDTLAKAG